MIRTIKYSGENGKEVIFVDFSGNKEVIRRFIEAYNNRDLEVFYELVAPDYIDHTHQQRGREEFKHLFTLAFEGFPDWHESIQDMIAEGEKVWVHVRATGTHSGQWTLFGVPLPPTGNKVVMDMVFMFRVVNGRLVEGGEVDDQVDFFKQLGLIEYTEKGERLFTVTQ
jgi:predicted ester cyclase